MLNSYQNDFNWSIVLKNVLSTKVFVHWTHIPFVLSIFYYTLNKSFDLSTFFLTLALTVSVLLINTLREIMLNSNKDDQHMGNRELVIFPVGSVSEPERTNARLSKKLFRKGRGYILDISLLIIIFIIMGGLDKYNAFGDIIKSGLTTDTFLINLFLSIGLLFMIRLFPVLPVDGGKLFREVLLAMKLNREEVDKIMSVTSQFLAWATVLLAVMWHPAFFLLSIILFLGANLDVTMSQFYEKLKTYKAHEVMNSFFETVDINENTAANEKALQSHQNVIIKQGDSVKGVLSNDEIKQYSELNQLSEQHCDEDLTVLNENDSMVKVFEMKDTTETIAVKNGNMVKGFIKLEDLKNEKV